MAKRDWNKLVPWPSNQSQNLKDGTLNQIAKLQKQSVPGASKIKCSSNNNIRLKTYGMLSYDIKVSNKI